MVPYPAPEGIGALRKRNGCVKGIEARDEKDTMRICVCF